MPFSSASFDTLIANHMLYHLDDPAAALREFSRVLRPGGRLAVAVNGREHLDKLNAIGPAIGRPDLTLRGTQNDVTAETAPTCIARDFTDVRVDVYPCDLNVPAPDPIMAYLDGLANEPLTREQRSAARDLVRAQINTHGSFHIRKHTVLVMGSRPTG